MSKVFLGGTTNNSIWRENLIKELKIDYFNPIVDDWNEDCIKEEEKQKWNECNIHLYDICQKNQWSSAIDMNGKIKSAKHFNKTFIFNKKHAR
jgi:hypothetical protein